MQPAVTYIWLHFSTGSSWDAAWWQKTPKCCPPIILDFQKVSYFSMQNCNWISYQLNHSGYVMVSNDVICHHTTCRSNISVFRHGFIFFIRKWRRKWRRRESAILNCRKCHILTFRNVGKGHFDIMICLLGTFWLDIFKRSGGMTYRKLKMASTAMLNEFNRK